MSAPKCERCKGERWVCENHRDKAWPEECGCGPGVNCPDCNDPPPGVFPDLHPGAEIMCSVWDDEKKILH